MLFLTTKNLRKVFANTVNPEALIRFPLTWKPYVSAFRRRLTSENYKRPDQMLFRRISFAVKVIRTGSKKVPFPKV